MFNIPPPLVLGCNNPTDVNVLKDCIQEQTGFDLIVNDSDLPKSSCNYEEENRHARGDAKYYGDWDFFNDGNGFGSSVFSYELGGNDGFGCGFGEEYGDGSGSSSEFDEHNGNGFGCGLAYGFGEEDGNGSGDD